LSENTAYQKLFRYGHQAPRLRLIWLDEDNGLHKRACKGVNFPNAEVVSVKDYYLQLSEHIDGNALIEGLERLKMLMRTWNDFLWPLIVLTDDTMYTLPVALANLTGEHVQDTELMMAGAVMTILPVMIIFIALQKY
jgi:hypothetical protein